MLSRITLTWLALSVSLAHAAPTERELVAIAGEVAAREAGARLTLVTQADHLDLDGSPRTRVYVWGPHGLVAADLDARRAADPAFQARFFSVEVGLRADVPPVVSYWRGLPLDIGGRPAAEAAAMRTTGSRRLRAVGRYGSALRPVLGYEDERGRVFVDLRTGGVGRRLTGPLVDRDARARALRRAWQVRLDAVREGGR